MSRPRIAVGDALYFKQQSTSGEVCVKSDIAHNVTANVTYNVQVSSGEWYSANDLYLRREEAANNRIAVRLPVLHFHLLHLNIHISDT